MFGFSGLLFPHPEKTGQAVRDHGCHCFLICVHPLNLGESVFQKFFLPQRRKGAKTRRKPKANS